MVRGVGGVDVEPGDAPVVRYEHDDIAHELRCRLIVGADGRMSTVRRQLGVEFHQNTPRIWGGHACRRSRRLAGPAILGRD
ncbi:MAG: FAD-dependent monooxygenase [Pseudonocardiales bacterium]|nr:FAD-dependent monooxygenase [Pseudonocardiales bacterium]MBV9651191.1 FAD-dependent monooxygenase [Pseudonocardiales bacterium]